MTLSVLLSWYIEKQFIIIQYHSVLPIGITWLKRLLVHLQMYNPWIMINMTSAWHYYYNNSLPKSLLNYANPVYGVAIICHQVRCLGWGHPSIFHTATSLIIWYKMFCMRDMSYRLTWMKFINMLSVYAQSGTHRRVNWWIITILT